MHFKECCLFLFRDVISSAGALVGEEKPPPRAHSIRAVSTSITFMRNWSVSRVLKSVAWRSNSVFASFYLRDIAFHGENGWSLSPFVSAGDVVN